VALVTQSIRQRIQHSFAKDVNSPILLAILFTIVVSSFAAAQATVKLTVKSGTDIGAEINDAIASLPNKTGTIELPSGSYVQSKTISVSGTGVHLVGAASRTTLNYSPSKYQLIDSADSSEGWQGSGVSIDVLTSFGEDHPDPMQGEAYIQVLTSSGSDHQVWKAIPATNFTVASKIGVWMSSNMTSPPLGTEFFISDGSHTAYWTLAPSSIYAQWKFYGLDLDRPSATDGGLPDFTRITRIGFRRLAGNMKYYFDAVAIYTPTGPSIVFSSCEQCSLSNVEVRWEPAADSDAAVAANQGTRELTLKNVHTVGAADGIRFEGQSDSISCKDCVAEFSTQSGFALRGSTNASQLTDVQANRNVNGIYVGSDATHNIISSARCTRNNSAGIVIDGNSNQIVNPYIDTWMTFGLVIRGGSHNSVTGVIARSAVGESAVQLIAGAAYNTLSSINIEESGGSGLDLGGGVKPQVWNTATNVIVHNSGSSSWHGGPKASSEGRGLCLCNANDNTISHLEIYETAQRSTVPGAEGIIINNGSSRNTLQDVVVYHSRHEGVTVWDASDNKLKNVRVIGNGLKEGNGAGMRIEAPAKNTTVEGFCYWMNGGGGLKNVSQSSSIKNARQVRNLDPKAPCQ
jgi:Right handed beta helix region